MSVFVPIACSLGYCSFVVLSEVWEGSFVHPCYFHSGLFWQFYISCVFHYIHFKIFVLVLWKKHHGWFACVCVCTQSFLTLCNSMDCISPVSTAHGIFQARILGQVTTSYLKGSSQPRVWTHVSCVSCIGRWILYHCITWEAFDMVPTTFDGIWIKFDKSSHSICRLLWVMWSFQQ